MNTTNKEQATTGERTLTVFGTIARDKEHERLCNIMREQGALEGSDAKTIHTACGLSTFVADLAVARIAEHLHTIPDFVWIAVGSKDQPPPKVLLAYRKLYCKMMDSANDLLEKQAEERKNNQQQTQGT